MSSCVVSVSSVYVTCYIVYQHSVACVCVSVCTSFIKALHTVQLSCIFMLHLRSFRCPSQLLSPSLPHPTTGGPGSCQGFGRQSHLGKIRENGTATGQPPGEQGAAVKFKINLPPCVHYCNTYVCIIYLYQASFTLCGCTVAHPSAASECTLPVLSSLLCR